MKLAPTRSEICATQGEGQPLLDRWSNIAGALRTSRGKLVIEVHRC